MEIYYNQYLISDSKKLLNLDTIKSLLSKSYWANHRSGEQIESSINNSRCYGVYYQEKQIGFARVITDFATMYWLCDVIIDEEYRGVGLGKKLVESITKSDDLINLTGLLVTKDAHELYEQYSFEIDTQHDYMRKKPI